MRILVFIFCLLAVPAGMVPGAWADTEPEGDAAAGRTAYARGLDAYHAGDFATARAELRRAARSELVPAMYVLGRLLEDGRGGPHDLPGARRWLERAARAGHAGAQNSLGLLYESERFDGADPEAARRWYRRAVANGHLTALNNLAYHDARRGERLEDALAMAREAVAERPRRALYLDTLGYVLARLGRLADALGPLCRSVAIDAGDVESRLHLGDVLWRLGQTTYAKAQWRAGDAIARGERPASRQGADTLFHRPSLERTLAARLRDGLPPPDPPPAETPLTADAASGACTHLAY